MKSATRQSISLFPSAYTWCNNEISTDSLPVQLTVYKVAYKREKKRVTR